MTPVYKLTAPGSFKIARTSYASMLAGNATWNPWEPQGAMDALASFVVPSGGTAEVTFAGIPTGYSSIEIYGLARCATNTDRNLRLYINGDMTNSNYRQHWLYGNGSTANSENNQVSPQIGYLPMSGDTAGIFGMTVTEIVDYASSTKTKVVKSLAGWDGNGSTSGMVMFGSGAYFANTNPVTSVTIKMSNGANLAEFSQFDLYGVR